METNMYRTIQLAIGAALAVLACGTAHSQDGSRITAVTLYPGSATVERTARVLPGATLLQITGLPANFDPQSVRVEADPGVAVGEVSTQDTARARSPDPREARLEERIQALRDRLAVLDGETRSAQMVTEFLSRLGAPGEKPAPIRPLRKLNPAWQIHSACR